MRQLQVLHFTLFFATTVVGVFAWQSEALASPITLTASDTMGSTSFNAAGNWSNGSAPMSGYDYEVSSSRQLRTPADSIASLYTFAGDSLTLDTSGMLKYKSTGGGTISISKLILNGGIVNVGNDACTWTLAGNIMLQSGGGTIYEADGGSQTNRVTNVSAVITGTGALTICDCSGNTSNSGCHVSLNGKNTYSGGTTIGSYAYAYVTTDGAMGTGNVTVSGTLILENGSTNDYIADTASMVVNSGGSVVLNYSGTDVISGLTVNGATYTSLGTYGASGSGATYTLSGFSGTGTLTLVPEPATTVMMVSGVAGLLAFAWRRRRNRQ